MNPFIVNSLEYFLNCNRECTDGCGIYLTTSCRKCVLDLFAEELAGDLDAYLSCGHPVPRELYMAVANYRQKVQQHQKRA